jgi:hypothetical protein
LPRLLRASAIGQLRKKRYHSVHILNTISNLDGNRTAAGPVDGVINGSSFAIFSFW